MAGRFCLFQNLPFRISSTSTRRLVSASASTSARNVAPVTRRASAARHFNTLPWLCQAAQTSRPTTGIPSVVTHRAKPAFVGSASRAKAAFSSTSPTKNTVTREAKHTACEAESVPEYRSASEVELEAEEKAIRDRFIAWKTKLDKDAADFSKLVNRLLLVWTLTGIGFVVDTNRRSCVHDKSSEITASDKC